MYHTGLLLPKPAGPPLTQCPPDRLWLDARRPAADSSPPDRRWLKPAGSPLTHACRSPLTLAPWIQSTSWPGVPGHVPRVMVLSLVLPSGTVLMYLVGLVHGDSSGAGGSSCSGRGGHSSHLPPCRGSGGGCWWTLWGPLTPCHAQKKPQLPS